MNTVKADLSKRLFAVASMVTKGNIVCDVGCDHGFVSIYLVKNKISPNVIAMDVNKGPLEAAKGHIEDSVLTKYIETRLSDGISSLKKEEADTIICAGMGGILIQRILEEGKEKLQSVKELILQPQSKIREVREYLRNNGYFISDENMILEDGKYYSVIKAVWKDNLLPEAKSQIADSLCDKYGPVLLANKNKILFKYLKKEQITCGKIMAEIMSFTGEDTSSSGKNSVRKKEIEDRMKDIILALSYYEV